MAAATLVVQHAGARASRGNWPPCILTIRNRFSRPPGADVRASAEYPPRSPAARPPCSPAACPPRRPPGSANSRRPEQPARGCSSATQRPATVRKRDAIAAG